MWHTGQNLGFEIRILDSCISQHKGFHNNSSAFSKGPCSSPVMKQ
jgi:hypothetical protein